jgi:predicted membrane protein
MMAMVIHGVGKNGSHFERRGFRFPILGLFILQSTGLCDSFATKLSVDAELCTLQRDGRS